MVEVNPCEVDTWMGVPVVGQGRGFEDPGYWATATHLARPRLSYVRIVRSSVTHFLGRLYPLRDFGGDTLTYVTNDKGNNEVLAGKRTTADIPF